MCQLIYAKSGSSKCIFITNEKSGSMHTRRTRPSLDILLKLYILSKYILSISQKYDYLFK